jgi:hypothetical protein
MSTELGNETVLMSIESGRYYGLEGAAQRIWSLLTAPQSLADLSIQLAKEYEVSPEQCAEDILPFVEEMISEGLLKVED